MDSCRSAGAQQRLHSLKTRSGLWFGHGCSGQRMLLEHEGNYGLGMDALVSVCSWNTKGIMVWAWMLWSAHSSKHEGNYGLGMDALVSVCSWNTKGIMVWAWMLGSAHSSKHEGNYGLGMDALVSALIKTRTELWFGHGCSGERDAFGTLANLLASQYFVKVVSCRTA